MDLHCMILLENLRRFVLKYVLIDAQHEKTKEYLAKRSNLRQKKSGETLGEAKTSQKKEGDGKSLQLAQVLFS